MQSTAVFLKILDLSGEILKSDIGFTLFKVLCDC